MKQLLIVLILAFGLAGATSDDFAQSRASHKYLNRDVGFAITKAPDWHFLSLDNAEMWMTSGDNSEEGRAQLKDHLKNLRAQKELTGMAPLFIARHEEPYPHVNPMIKVNLHYIDDLPDNVSPLAIAAAMAQSIQQNNKGIQLDDRVSLTRVSSFDAGYIRFTLNGELHSGEKEGSVNQVYLIPRGKYVFEITLSTPLECDAATEEDLQDMMESIFILKPFEV